MRHTQTEVSQALATHQRVALGFVVGTAVVVLLSAVIAGVATLMGRQRQPAPTPSPTTSDRTFQTQ